MKENDAKLRWCPFVRVDVFDGGNHHLYEINDKCQGSQCMAFRWKTSPAQAAEVNARGNAGAQSDGYCGLAGKP